jgi:hypothetical protein
MDATAPAVVAAVSIPQNGWHREAVHDLSAFP